MAAAAGVQAAASVRYPTPASRRGHGLRHVRRGGAAAVAGVLGAGRRPLLDSRAPVLRRASNAGWIRSCRSWRRPPALAADRRRRLSAACIRCSTSPPRSIRGSTSPTGSARSFSPSRPRAAPAGPTWRSRSSKRVCASGPTSGNTCRTSASCTTGGARLPGGGRLVRQGQRRAGRAVVAEVAGGDDAGARRRSAIVAADVGSDPAVGGDRLAETGSRAPSGAARRARRDRSPSAGG